MAHEAAPTLKRMRHLLNVWIRAGEAPGRRADLAKVRVQAASLWIDKLNHVLAVTSQSLLHRPVLKELCDDWILQSQRLQLPIARRVRQRNAEASQRFGHLLLRIEVDVRARRPEQRSLSDPFAEHLL